jgi:methionyl-tRNA synthetase
MPSPPRKILLTTALIYANGPVHLGHMVEHIQADIWARFQKMQGNHCLFISGSDAHGTPIMIAAEKEGITPEALVEQVHQTHRLDFEGFHVAFDHFDTTHAPENKQYVDLVYQRLYDKGDISTRTIEQAYDPIKSMFLPDRYVKGECPRCAAQNQYGDSCEACGATYAPTELKNPISTLSGAVPIQKESLHYFFHLENYAQMLKAWSTSGKLQKQVANKLSEWFEVGLRAWDISRDAPYFGFEIPNAPNKYFYVWLDAPIGYISCFKKLCAIQPDIHFEEYWEKDSSVELYHFIGKDIIYFHALFWPALLEGAHFRTPSGIFAHGFLTVDGQKMSKSRGTFITARDYLNHLNPEYLRYYFAAKLNGHVEDIDLNFEDFTQRVNADLVGKYVNLASRCAGFITKFFDNTLSAELDNLPLFTHFAAQGESIGLLYEVREYQKAMREIMQLADMANQYIDQMKPWALAKIPEELPRVQLICTTGLNLFKILTIYLKPILPKTAQAVETFLQIPPLTWADLTAPLTNHSIHTFQPLLQRVDPQAIEALLKSNNVPMS